MIRRNHSRTTHPRWRRSAVAAALLLAAIGCGDQGPPSGTGSTRTAILLTDAPFPYDSIAQVNIHIERIEVSASTDTTPGGAGWVTVVAPKAVFNLLDYQNGATALLGEVSLPTGQYKSIRMTIDKNRSSLVDRAGRPVTVHWGGAGLATLYAYVENPIDVGGGGSIVIDFDVGRSFLCPGNVCDNGLYFSPVFRAVDPSATGSISGTVQGDGSNVANATIEVLSDRDSVSDLALWAASYATGRTDSQGRFKVAFLKPGTYRVRVTSPRSSTFASAEKRLLVVSAGANRDAGTIAVPRLSDVALTLSALGGPIRTGDSALVHVTGTIAGDSVRPPDVTWSSSNPAVVRVQSAWIGAALVIGVQAGTATITATAGSRSASTQVVVIARQAPAALHSVTIVPNAVNPFVGDSLGLRAVLRDSSGVELTDARSIVWASSDPSVVGIRWSYDRHVLLDNKKPGTATVTATTGGKSGSATVTVKARP